MLIVSAAGILAATFVSNSIWKLVVGQVIYSLLTWFDAPLQIPTRALTLPVACMQFVASCSIFLMVCRLQKEGVQRHSMLSTSQHVFSLALFGVCRTLHHLKKWTYDSLLQVSALMAIIFSVAFAGESTSAKSAPTTDWATFMLLLLAHALFVPAETKWHTSERVARILAQLALMLTFFIAPAQQRFKFYHAALPIPAKVFVAVWSALVAARSFSVLIQDIWTPRKECISKVEKDDAMSGLAFAGILTAAYCISSMHIEHGNKEGSYDGENYMFQGLMATLVGTGGPVLIQIVAKKMYISRLKGKKIP